MEQHGDNFKSRIGVLLALAGSAIGLGNLWRFPYLLGTNGGAAFIIIYLFFVFIICLPIMFSEFTIGRRSGANAFRAFRKLSPGSKWNFMGIFVVLTPILVVSFYSVVGGWTIDYMVKAATGVFSGTSQQLSSLFSDTISSPLGPIIYMLVFLALSCLVLLAGVEKGIERFSKVMMPALFVMIVIIAVRSVTLKGAGAGLSFLFNPDFSKVTPHTFMDALGQAFFSLSLGCGTIITYASYVAKKESIVGISAQTAIADTTFALLAGVAIMPAVFAFGISPSQGPGLVFVTLPYIFSHLPLGNLLGVIFFFVLFIAAITSAISLIEVAVAYFKEEFKVNRVAAVVISFAVVAVIGAFCSLSQGNVLHIELFGKNLFDLLDSASANILMPLGGLFSVIFVGWILKKPNVSDELTSSGAVRIKKAAIDIIFFLIKYIAPVAIIVIMLGAWL